MASLAARKIDARFGNTQVPQHSGSASIGKG
jgi:hypothetical protein